MAPKVWEPKKKGGEEEEILVNTFEKVKGTRIAPNTVLLFDNTVNLRKFPRTQLLVQTVNFLSRIMCYLLCSTRNCGSVLTQPDFLLALKFVHENLSRNILGEVDRRLS